MAVVFLKTFTGKPDVNIFPVLVRSQLTKDLPGGLISRFSSSLSGTGLIGIAIASEFSALCHSEVTTQAC
jgi:hypothetical protein